MPPDPPDEARPLDPRATRTQKLALDAQRGDRSRFDELYRRTAPAILAWAELRLPAATGRSPQDLLQEVWSRAFERFAQYDEKRGTFRQWMFGFARRVLREWRRAERRAGAPARLDPEDVARQSTAIPMRVARGELMQKLLQQFWQLQEYERHLLVQRGLEGRDHAEIAAELRIDAATVRKRWQRLRDRLERQGLPDQLLER